MIHFLNKKIKVTKDDSLEDVYEIKPLKKKGPNLSEVQIFWMHNAVQIF